MENLHLEFHVSRLSFVDPKPQTPLGWPQKSWIFDNPNACNIYLSLYQLDLFAYIYIVSNAKHINISTMTNMESPKSFCSLHHTIDLLLRKTIDTAPRVPGPCKLYCFTYWDYPNMYTHKTRRNIDFLDFHDMVVNAFQFVCPPEAFSGQIIVRYHVSPNGVKLGAAKSPSMGFCWNP